MGEKDMEIERLQELVEALQTGEQSSVIVALKQQIAKLEGENEQYA